MSIVITETDIKNLRSNLIAAATSALLAAGTVDAAFSGDWFFAVGFACAWYFYVYHPQNRIDDMSWMTVTPSNMPKPGKQVMVVYQDGDYRARYLGRWIAPYTIVSDPDDDGMLDTKDGVDYWASGWYLDGLEHTGEDIMVAVAQDRITHWQPVCRLPEI